MEAEAAIKNYKAAPIDYHSVRTKFNVEKPRGGAVGVNCPDGTV